MHIKQQVWGCNGEAPSCWFSCFSDWIIHLGLITLSSCALVLFLSSSSALLVWLNTFPYPLLPPLRLLSALILPPMLSFILPLSISASLIQPIHFQVFTSFLWTPCSLYFPPLFNLDFHHTLFCLSCSHPLSFYVFWWQSQIFTSQCRTTSLSPPTLPLSSPSRSFLLRLY